MKCSLNTGTWTPFSPKFIFQDFFTLCFSWNGSTENGNNGILRFFLNVCKSFDMLGSQLGPVAFICSGENRDWELSQCPVENSVSQQRASLRNEFLCSLRISCRYWCALGNRFYFLKTFFFFFKVFISFFPFLKFLLRYSSFTILW